MGDGTVRSGHGAGELRPGPGAAAVERDAASRRAARVAARRPARARSMSRHAYALHGRQRRRSARVEAGLRALSDAAPAACGAGASAPPARRGDSRPRRRPPRAAPGGDPRTPHTTWTLRYPQT